MAKKKILIAEDSELQRDILKYVLDSNPEWEVLTAADGVETLEVVKKRSPDLLILDVMMPKMNGFEVCYRLKMDPNFKHIPVLILTSTSEGSSKSDEHWRRRSRADDFITKPFQSKDIMERVNQLFDRTGEPGEAGGAGRYQL